MIRVDKLVCSQIADLFRKDVKQLCKKGLITVGGKKVGAEDKIDENEQIVVDGRILCVRKNVCIMMNKPKDVVCSTKDGISRTVIELLDEDLQFKNLFPAGRLDKDSTGFVLLTNDGQLSHKMLSPKKHVPKTYIVGLENDAKSEYINAFESGMEIDGGDVCKPAKLFIDENNKKICKVVLYEGMYHQIKRMFARLGNKVVSLHRTHIGGLELDRNLQLGQARMLENFEIERIFSFDLRNT